MIPLKTLEGLVVIASIIILFIAVFCLPAYLYSRKRNKESFWFLFASAPGIVFWFALTLFGYGEQTFLNAILEIIIFVIVAIVFANLKVFAVDRFWRFSKYSTCILMAVLLLAAFLLRTFTPSYSSYHGQSLPFL